jgi:ParB family chromosome partitioning protein
MAKRKSLGRGLDALLSSGSRSESGAAPDAGTPQTDLKDLPVDLLRRGKYQPRIDMHEDTLRELAESIRVQGIVQPIVVRPVGRTDGEMHYEIIAGERRWRAAQLAGMDAKPAAIASVCSFFR